MAYRDPAVGRARDRERFQRRTAERIARGLCPRCGKRPPAPGRSVCEPCGEKRNGASRARDAKLRAAGKPRRDPERARTYERKRDRRVSAERAARRPCARCVGGLSPNATGREAKRWPRSRGDGHVRRRVQVSGKAVRNRLGGYLHRCPCKVGVSGGSLDPSVTERLGHHRKVLARDESRGPKTVSPVVEILLAVCPALDSWGQCGFTCVAGSV